MYEKKSTNFVQTSATIFLVVFFYVTSISLTFYNKWLMKKYRFPLTVSMVHFIVVFLLAVFWRRFLMLYQKKERTILECKTYVTKVFPTAISASLDIGLSNWSVMLSTVSLYTMAKSSSIIFVLIFSLMFKLEKATWRLLGTIVLISAGLFLFTYKSSDVDTLGLIMALLASVMCGIRWTTAQLVMQKKALGLGNPIDAIYHVQPVMALTMVVMAFSLEGTEFASSVLIFRAPSFHVVMTTIGVILFGAFLAFLLTVSEFLLISRTSGLALSIAGIFKEVCTLTIAAEFAGDELNMMNSIGLVLCLLGIILRVIGNALQDSSSRKTESSSNDPESIAMRSLLREGFVSDSEDEVFFDTTRRSRMKKQATQYKYSNIKHGD